MSYLEWENKSPEEFNVVVGKKNFFNYLISSYGGINSILKSSSFLFNLLNFDKRKNTKTTKILKLSKKIIPLMLLSIDLKNKIIDYCKKDKDVRDDKREKIRLLMKVNSVNKFNDFHLGNEINKWILDYPKLKDIKIIGYYNFKDLKKINSSNAFFDEGEIVIILLYNSMKYAYKINTAKILNTIIPMSSELYAEEYDEKEVLNFNGKIISEYVNNLDIKNNVLYYENVLKTRPKSTEVKYKIQQIDVKKFAQEIKTVLDMNKKRGYILIGKPGTGKTAILMQLEKILKQYPFIYINPIIMKNYLGIEGLFNFLKYVKNSIVIFEDLDSFGFEEKSKELGIFLNYIDNMKNKANVVYIATVNNSKKIHFSLINRRGRFDEIKEISPPKSINEVNEIMKSHYRLNIEKNKNLNVGWNNLRKMKKNNFTQADICEVVNKIKLNKKETFNKKTIKEAICSVQNSKKAIKKYYSENLRENY